MNPTVEATAIGLGMTRARNKKWGPCPACGDDSREPAVQIGYGWQCFRCGAKGDAVDLVSFALNGCKGREAGSRFRAVLDWFRDQHIVLDRVHHDDQDDDYQPSRVPEAELREFFRHAMRASKSNRKDVQEFLSARGYELPVHGWVAPKHLSTKWWPSYFTEHYPLVVPAFTGTGTLAGLHGRAVNLDNDGPKTRWAKGFDATGLFFADYLGGLPFLRREHTPEQLIFVEGITDFLWMSQHASAKRAILGIESGSARGLKLLPNLDGIEVYVGTDPDETGDRYAQKIADELAPHLVHRIPLHLLDEAA